MVERRAYLATLLIDQNVKVYIDVAPKCFVERVLVELGLLLLFVLATSIGPGGLHLLDVVDDVAGARLAVLLHLVVVVSVPAQLLG